MHHSRFSNKHVELVYTKYEVKRSIIKGGRRIQPDNPVFDTLTVAQYLPVAQQVHTVGGGGLRPGQHAHRCDFRGC